MKLTLTIKQTTELCGISPAKLRRMMLDGRLKGYISEHRKAMRPSLYSVMVDLLQVDPDVAIRAVMQLMQGMPTADPEPGRPTAAEVEAAEARSEKRRRRAPAPTRSAMTDPLTRHLQGRLQRAADVAKLRRRSRRPPDKEAALLAYEIRQRIKGGKG